MRFIIIGANNKNSIYNVAYFIRKMTVSTIIIQWTFLIFPIRALINV